MIIEALEPGRSFINGCLDLRAIVTASTVIVRAFLERVGHVDSEQKGSNQADYGAARRPRRN